jgi:hypothetical protein
MTSSAAAIVSMLSERSAKAILAQHLLCRMRRKTRSQPSPFRSSKAHAIAGRPFPYWSPMALKIAQTPGVQIGSRYRSPRLPPPAATDAGTAQSLGAYDIPQFNRRQGYQSEIGYVLKIGRRAASEDRSQGDSDRRNRSEILLSADIGFTNNFRDECGRRGTGGKRPAAALHLTIFTPLWRVFARKS